MVCDRMAIVEGEVGVIDEVGVGVALDHRQALRHAGIHPGLAELDAAAVDAALLGQQAQQRAVAAADIEHARAGRHHLGDEQQIDAAACRWRGRRAAAR